MILGGKLSLPTLKYFLGDLNLVYFENHRSQAQAPLKGDGLVQNISRPNMVVLLVRTFGLAIGDYLFDKKDRVPCDLISNLKFLICNFQKKMKFKLLENIYFFKNYTIGKFIFKRVAIFFRIFIKVKYNSISKNKPFKIIIQIKCRSSCFESKIIQ